MVAAATAAMISGFLLSMSISCNSEFRAADYCAAAIVITVRPEFSAATEMAMAALELAVKDLLLFR